MGKNSRLIALSSSILNRRALLWLFVTTVMLAALLGQWRWPTPVNAAPANEATAETVAVNLFHATQLDPMQQTAVPTDLSCRLCHGDTTTDLTLQSGETVHLGVDLAALNASAHGLGADSPLACTDCHRPPADYRVPHAPVTAVDLAAYRLEQSDSCVHCHTPHLTSHTGPESAEPVLCADCHTGHAVQTTAVWQAGEATTACLTCHEADDHNRLTGLIQAGMFASEPDNEYCLSCHSQPDLTMTLASGEQLDLTVDRDDFSHSVHGLDNAWQPLNCVDCHQNYLYPHEAVTAVTSREYALQKYQVCADCHDQNYNHTLDSVHGQALAEGNLDAAMCTDCHSPHDMPSPADPRSRIPHTCETCHSEAYEEYARSVHGQELFNEENPDVPSCTDCHGVHTISDPDTPTARADSPLMCAQCHADPEMMARYDISMDVFTTYVADFHGTTALLFDNADNPDAELNVALCIDCHSNHAIMRHDDPEAGIQENLLITCQECHPTATANFPAAWTSHHQPSLEHNRLTFLVITFYQIFIPLVLGPLTFLVLTDAYRRYIRRR